MVSDFGMEMKLFKKHIGQLFDNRGADGSWYYLLVDVKKDKLLFYYNGKYEIDSNRYADWRPFEIALPSKKEIKLGWKTGRVAQ